MDRRLHRVRRMRRFSLVVGLLLACGCSKRASSALEEHADDFARIDKIIAQGNAAIAKIPERGIKQVGRCKPDPSWSWGAYGQGVHNMDVVPGSAMGWTNALGDSLDLRRRNQGKGYFDSEKLTYHETSKLDQLKDIKHFIFIRDHKSSDKFHLTADVFVFNGDTGKLTCAFGFDGGEGAYGSEGTVKGKEIITNKKTGKVVAERDWVEGKSDGTTGAYEARNKVGSHFGRVLGVFIMGDKDVEAAAKAARDGTAEKGLGKYGTTQIDRVLEERAAPVGRPSRPHGVGEETEWYGEGFRVSLVNASDVYGSPVTNAAIGAEQAVAIEGLNDNLATASALVAKPWRGQAELLGRLRGLGIQIPAPPAETPSVEGMRRYTLQGKKDAFTVKVFVADYSAAAQKQNNSALRIDGKRVVVVRSTNPLLGTAEEIATEIVTSKF